MSAASAPDFARDIRPLLSDRCFTCHGPDAAKRQANLRLDTQDGISAKTDELLERITTNDPAKRMPPAYMGQEPLAADQIAILQSWVKAGAPYTAHWAFEPPKRHGGESIDDFAEARLENVGLSFSPAAPPAAWLRRVTLDLTGLPPTPNEYEQFTSPEAAVDRLLASPRYGERMAIDWLDVARYADTHGFNNDSERQMWRWRDWVINAFNENLPYDQFITEQLAGDLLPDPTLDQLIATGFNRNHVINSEGGIIDEEYRVEYVVDRVRTLGMAWLGLTIECARCHDHKYDPISQKDYYRFYAFFNTVPEIGEAGRVANAPPMISAPTPQQRLEIERLAERVRELEQKTYPGLSYSDYRGLIREVRRRSPGPAAVSYRCEAGCAEPVALDNSALKLAKDGSFGISLWIRPNKPQADAALVSSADYAIDPASSKYAEGVDLRLVGDEIELRMTKRFPSYSATVRSIGAGIEPGEWRHLAATYHGADGGSFGRSGAVGVRLYVDGIELDTRILHDDLMGRPKFLKVTTIGADSSPGRAPFDGLIDQPQVWGQALDHEAVLSRFLTRPLKQLRYSLFDRELAEARRALLAAKHSAPTTMVMAEMAEPRTTKVLNRGMYDQPGEVVEPAVPEQLLGSFPADAPNNRLGLARWLTSDDHPLTARVVVNRLWQQFFGVGLVKTSENFGYQGEPPSHPELLDWLAREFIDSGWDVKALVKRIVLSRAYAQDSAVTPDLLERDPENRLLARGPRHRLPAEVIRDQALALAGLLEHRLGGPSVKPYQPKGLYDTIVVGADYPGSTWETSSGADLYRRSLYTYWKRTMPHPALTVFDAPDREFCIVRRTTTNTPLQALTLLNDPTYVEAARKFAERMITEGGATARERIAFAFRTATGREIEPDEAEVLVATLERMMSSYNGDAAAAAKLLRVGEAPSSDEIRAAELAAYSTIASMILNLDETLNKG